MARHLDLAKFKKLLEDERARVLDEIEGIRSMDSTASEQDETGELSAYDEHTGDTGTETFERERDLAIGADAETILRQVEIALKKIEDGTYGICERCGEIIPAARLEAIPYTPFCIKDAERMAGQG
jgi:RNA polymerase-binding transcription factor DksA